jgi:hypothetical protein
MCHHNELLIYNCHTLEKDSILILGRAIQEIKHEKYFTFFNIYKWDFDIEILMTIKGNGEFKVFIYVMLIKSF